MVKSVQESPSEDNSLDNSIDEEIGSFVHNIDALHVTLPAQTMMASAIHMACDKSFLSFVDANCQTKPGTDDTYQVTPEHYLEFNRLRSRNRKAYAATVIIPQTFLVALVSQYDSFLGGLLRCLYRSKPEMLRQSEKTLTYAQLFEFSDMEEAKESILEKEIETLLRDSHHEQFAVMGRRFDIPLTTGLPIWPVFIELTQRRNLFVHCDGKVTAQYLKICDEYKVKYGARPSLGNRLDVDTKYFNQAHACVYEIGVKLAHVLWRKLIPEQREQADLNLLMLGYDLLVTGHYDLSATLGVFSLETIKTHSNADVRRRMVINLAQAYRWGGHQARATRVIDKEDWSSCDILFRLSVAVLRDDFSKAASLMKLAAAASMIKKNDYRDWPLFTEFRKSNGFATTYESLYGQPLATLEPDQTDSLFLSPTKSPSPKAVEEGSSSVTAPAATKTPEATNLATADPPVTADLPPAN